MLPERPLAFFEHIFFGFSGIICTVGLSLGIESLAVVVGWSQDGLVVKAGAGVDSLLVDDTWSMEGLAVKVDNGADSLLGADTFRSNIGFGSVIGADTLDGLADRADSGCGSLVGWSGLDMMSMDDGSEVSADSGRGK